MEYVGGVLKGGPSIGSCCRLKYWHDAMMVKRYCGGNRGARETELGSPRMWDLWPTLDCLQLTARDINFWRYIFISGDIKLLQPLSVWNFCATVQRVFQGQGPLAELKLWSKLAALARCGWKSNKKRGYGYMRISCLKNTLTWDLLLLYVLWADSFHICKRPWLQV